MLLFNDPLANLQSRRTQSAETFSNPLFFGALLLPSWPNPSLQLFKPIEHDVYLGRCQLLLTRPNHHEPLAVRCDIVASPCSGIGRVTSLEEYPRLGRAETGLCRQVHDHHL